MIKWIKKMFHVEQNQKSGKVRTLRPPPPPPDRPYQKDSGITITTVGEEVDRLEKENAELKRRLDQTNLVWIRTFRNLRIRYEREKGGK